MAAHPLHILITGARAPVALELARAFGRAGQRAYVADSMAPTMAGASRYAAGSARLPAPRADPAAFARALLDLVGRWRIDLLVPTCEEVFYVAMAHAELAARTRPFCMPLAALAPLHDKAAFQARAAALGLATPRTAVLRSPAELRAALPAFPRYLLKPAFSRFAARVITNCGPHAGRRPLAACRPTPQDPWLLQEYLNGPAVCTYSALHAGHVALHCAYATPLTAGLGAGTAFVALDGHATLAIVRALAPAFTGQLSLDLIRAADGRLHLLECNPRATSGLHLIDPEQIVGGLIDPQHPTWVAPPGRRRQLTPLALGAALRQLLKGKGPGGAGAWPELPAALRAPDVVFRPDDPLPALAQLAQVLHFLRVSRRERIGLLAATTADIEWNGA